MQTKKYAILAVILAVLLAVAPLFSATTAPVVAQSDNVVVIAPGDTVRLGLATDLSNLIPGPGLDIAQAAELAVILFNEENLLEGFEVELVVEDDRCTGEDATAVANLFASDPNIVGVVGHVCSGASIPASEIYEAARIPMVSPSSTAGAFTARGLDVTNRVAFNDNFQGVVAAGYIFSELEAESIAVLHDNSSYGEGLASTVADTFAELGGEVITFQAIDPTQQDYRSLLTVLVETQPDVVYFGGYESQAALLAEQIIEVGLESVFFSDDGVYTATFIELAGDAAEGSFVTFGQQLGDEEANEEFDALYAEAFGVAPDELGPFHAQSFDAAVVLLTALLEVAELDADGNLVIDREAFIETVRATSDLEGLSGLITCDEVGDCGSALISVFVVEDGEWVELEVPEELQVGMPMDDMDDMDDMEATEEAE